MSDEEWFDVVDEVDRVVGRATRVQAHAQGLRHRAIHVLLFDDQGQIYLQRRSWEKDKHPGCWDSSCSGHVDSGETYDLAAHRELGEELGLRAPPPLERLFKISASVQTGMEFIWVYRGSWNGPLHPNPREIIEGAYHRLDDVDRRIALGDGLFAPSFTFLWSIYRRQFRL
jgi:isopentenyl-diphosphate delta-isomerase type 1